jgi:hypothetical protein
LRISEYQPIIIQKNSNRLKKACHSDLRNKQEGASIPINVMCSLLAQLLSTCWLEKTQSKLVVLIPRLTNQLHQLLSQISKNFSLPWWTLSFHAWEINRQTDIVGKRYLTILFSIMFRRFLSKRPGIKIWQKFINRKDRSIML